MQSLSWGSILNPTWPILLLTILLPETPIGSNTHSKRQPSVRISENEDAAVFFRVALTFEIC